MADYKIGRGRPPEKYQYKKGESGNPRGRPKGRRSLSSVIQSALKQRVVITENGKKRKVTKLEAAVGSLITNAIAGDVRALHAVASFMPADDIAAPTAEDLSEQDRKLLEELSRRFQDKIQ